MPADSLKGGRRTLILLRPSAFPNPATPCWTKDWSVSRLPTLLVGSKDAKEGPRCSGILHFLTEFGSSTLRKCSDTFPNVLKEFPCIFFLSTILQLFFFIPNTSFHVMIITVICSLIVYVLVLSLCIFFLLFTPLNILRAFEIFIRRVFPSPVTFPRLLSLFFFLLSVLAAQTAIFTHWGYY